MFFRNGTAAYKRAEHGDWFGAAVRANTARSVHVNKLIQTQQYLAEIGESQIDPLAGLAMARRLALDEGQHPLALGRRRHARERDAIGLVDGHGHGGFIDAGGQLLRALADKRRIHHRQSLGRQGGARPFADALNRLGRVEHLQERYQLAALHRQVDTAAVAVAVERSGPERGRIEGPANGQDGVADGLRLQPRGGST